MVSRKQGLQMEKRGSTRNGQGSSSRQTASHPAAPASLVRRLRRKVGGLVAYSVSWYRY